MQRLYERLIGARSISIITHKRPDLDTIGTALGIFELLKHSKEVKAKVEVVCEVIPPKRWGFLPHFGKLKCRRDYSDSVAIVVDCASADRACVSLEGSEVVVIDHHISNSGFGDINIIDSTAASTALVALRAFEQFFEINRLVATAWMAAIYSDSKGFSSSQVDDRLFETVAYLMRKGADVAKIAQQIKQNMPLSWARIRARALESLRLLKEGRVALIWIDSEDIKATGAGTFEIDGIVDYGLELVNVEVAILVVEHQSYFKVSLRSKGVDVAKIAAHFGGGGHKRAAGFEIDYRQKDEIEPRLLEYICKEMECARG